MQFEIARARDFYASADKGIPYITPECRLPVVLARRLYAKILDKIEANGYDVFRRAAPAPPAWRKPPKSSASASTRRFVRTPTPPVTSGKSP